MEKIDLFRNILLLKSHFLRRNVSNSDLCKFPNLESPFFFGSRNEYQLYQKIFYAEHVQGKDGCPIKATFMKQIVTAAPLEF